ncbi:alanine dehydrogenase [[Mycoplasma] mobile]|uniref:Alanine dehydrogenase n=1 Tax=Mycoplasma mobile (strain ATCC 43663 / 163K / NCTC 11711) TaxID=267748 RepID=Q6KIJ0_MYCM1|nr:alanine dehydrogenase [[Mycoplasma] mobile]AAT27586.1 alanine dehydrogenase [Mycoplasma mobile 163K]
MKIGFPKEIKNNEFRIGVTPNIVSDLVKNKHEVLIEKNAGLEAGFSDEDFIKSGAKISTQEEVWKSPFIIKIKEPLESEFKFFKKDQVIFTYFHLATDPKLAKALMDSQAIGLAYELVRKDNKNILLAPMSVVAGKLAILNGAFYLQKQNKGFGILPGGIEGTRHGKTLVVGGGIVGQSAAWNSLIIGQNTVVLDKNEALIKQLNESKEFKNASTLSKGKFEAYVSDEKTLTEHIKDADLVVSTIHIPGAKVAKLITKTHVESMKKGSVIVDVAIDQGGSVETIIAPTSHSNPISEYKGILQYAVPNMPGATPRTASLALTNATEFYIHEIANKGFLNSIKSAKELFGGVLAYKGKMTNENIAKALKLEFVPLEKLL